MAGIDIADPRVEQYAAEHSSPEAPHLTAVAEETHRATSAPGMMVGRLEGSFLAALVALRQPAAVLEIGTFTGYSALTMAAELPPGAKITTCDIDPDHVAIATRHIEASPYADRIEIRLGPAQETVEGLDGPFDLVFIDADKTGYLDYYEAVLPKLAPHGMIVVDNVLWSGRVLDPDGADGADGADSSGDSDRADASTAALRAFNDHVAADDRVRTSMLTIRDGVTMIWRADG
jgi:caffeoyl-CoA O-methyltransferase